MTCDAKIRPFPGTTEIQCEVDSLDGHDEHVAVLRDYAYEGSKTIMRWHEDDRRTFHGEWPGPCLLGPACVLPRGHRGGCAP